MWSFACVALFYVWALSVLDFILWALVYASFCFCMLFSVSVFVYRHELLCVGFDLCDFFIVLFGATISIAEILLFRFSTIYLLSLFRPPRFRSRRTGTSFFGLLGGEGKLLKVYEEKRKRKKDIVLIIFIMCQYMAHTV